MPKTDEQRGCDGSGGGEILTGTFYPTSSNQRPTLETNVSYDGKSAERLDDLDTTGDTIRPRRTRKRKQVISKEYRRAYYLKNKDRVHRHTRAWERRNIDRVRAAKREYNNRKYRENPAPVKARAQSWVNRFPWAMRAHRQVYEAIKSGTLAASPCCTTCGAVGRVDGHHDDYLRPLDVVWLCRICHSVHHETNGPASPDLTPEKWRRHVKATRPAKRKASRRPRVQGRWECGYRMHGFWRGGERLGFVGRPPGKATALKEHGYSFGIGVETMGSRKTLKGAKRAVERLLAPAPIGGVA